ncbi:MAG: ankyrin repeat domain-containing protein [Acidobacteriaceae bacterium]|nr:ankyrin repeat domain-containing protein [Acidobacteriaceae bacterium]
MLRRFLVGISLTAVSFAATDTRLVDAAMTGDRAAVRVLLKAKPALNTAHGDGATALHWAVYNDDLELVRDLLAAGAAVNVQTNEGSLTPLLIACLNGSPAIMEVLLKAGADPNMVNANGSTALMLASRSGSAEAVKLLLDRNVQVDAVESHGQTALMFAAGQNRVEVVKLLLSHGAQPDAATPVRKMVRVRFDQDGNIVDDAKPAPKAAAAAAPSDPAADLNGFARALGFESALFRPDAAGKHKAKAGDVAARGPRKIGADTMGGMTALLYASREGNLEVVRALVEGGATVNHVQDGDKFSPLVIAIVNGHYDVAKYLLDHNADPNLATTSGLGALYATIDMQWAPKTWVPQPRTDQEKTTYLELMQELLDHGANVNAQLGEKLWFRSFTNDYTWVDPTGATPLWRAAQSSDIAAMKLLVAHKADPQIKTKEGLLPLHAAAGIGWAGNWSVNAPYPAVEAVKYCVELGNDVNATDLRGYTPLHGAAYLGNNDMVNFLVAKGANVQVKSKAGDSVADMANGPTRFGQPHPETAALLEKLGSPNSHNCRSDQCVVASKSQIYDNRTAADFVQSGQMDALAHALGFKSAEYHADAGSGRAAAKSGDQNRD